MSKLWSLVYLSCCRVHTGSRNSAPLPCTNISPFELDFLQENTSQQLHSPDSLSAFSFVWKWQCENMVFLLHHSIFGPKTYWPCKGQIIYWCIYCTLVSVSTAYFGRWVLHSKVCPCQFDGSCDSLCRGSMCDGSLLWAIQATATAIPFY